MEEKQIAAQAAALLKAEQGGVPTAATPSPLTFAEAYAVQDALLRLKIASGSRLRGYKVGLTSPILQKGMGAAEPIYGHLTDAMVHASGSTILTEATLSFLGLGVKYPFASWGNIINDVNNAYVMTNYLFIWVPAGICLLITVLGFNFVGDGLRDAFDPKMKR